MFILLILVFFNALNAETFYLQKRSTAFYKLTVQVNGSDITNLFNQDKLVIDDFVIEGPNMLSICYSYNADLGTPNVKQLAKVELYNTKVNTKIRGLASLTSKTLVPEYVSVSPQSMRFNKKNDEKCVTHNFEDYTQEQLLAMKTHFNPVYEEESQIAEVLPVNDNQQTDDSLPTEEAVVNELPLVNDQSSKPEVEMLVQDSNEENSEFNKLITDEPNQANDSTTAEADLSPVAVDEVSSEEALNYIPAEDFISSASNGPANQQSLEVTDDIKNEFDMASEDNLEVDQVNESMVEEDNTVMENNSEFLVLEDTAVADEVKESTVNKDNVVMEESAEEAMFENTEEQINTDNNQRDVASEKEQETLSDEEFFSELNISGEESEAK